MKALSIGLAVVAMIAGLVAAWRWYQSSKVAIDPGWGAPGEAALMEPVDPELRALDLQVASDQAFGQTGRLNASASLWTAASVLFSAASAIVGALS
jgi:hypothetical protein